MEPEKSSKKSMIILGIIVVLLVVGFVLWKYKGRSQQQQEDSVPTLGSTISNEVKAPTDAVPDVNPYKAETNPFEKANPFSDVYKNPFEK